MPFGIAPAPEMFQQKLDEAVSGLKGAKLLLMTYSFTEKAILLWKQRGTMTNALLLCYKELARRA